MIGDRHVQLHLVHDYRAVLLPIVPALVAARVLFRLGVQLIPIGDICLAFCAGSSHVQARPLLLIFFSDSHHERVCLHPARGSPRHCGGLPARGGHLKIPITGDSACCSSSSRTS
ncbi:hypothetical protein CENSYa_1461 [Cenarchaeum symbiosum A]|uniref:Uncharacterized protein n=1 Tax=Cenarchaeum symbiosum (strain A) TaxID=414004 RepID=A0RXL6_CENSY|nr:hypothetical protein CENSYa_1461 [Cenarchaeum symbiosum A]